MAKAINHFLEIFKVPKLSSRSARNMQNVKCNCCETRLNSSDKETKSFIAKYPRCSHCRQQVCRKCRENSKCHECTVKLSIVRNPENLMQLDKITLLGLLKKLHYEDNIFDNWEKPYLVKQLLTRFQEYENWDPRHYNDTAKWVGASVKIREDEIANEAAHTRDSSRPVEGARSAKSVRTPDATRSAKSVRTPDATRSTGITRAARTTTKEERHHKKSTRKSHPETNVPEEVQRMKFERVGDHIYSLPIQRKMLLAAQDEVQERHLVAPAIPRQTRSMNRVPSMSLEDIPSANYFEDLNADEMKSILKKSIDSNSIMGQDELKLILQMLWTNMRKENPEGNAPKPAVQQSQMRPYYSERHLNRMECDAPSPVQSQHHSYKLSLADCPRSSSPTEIAEDTSTNMSHFSVSMGALNLLDTKEKKKKSKLSSTSFRGTTSARLGAKYFESKKPAPSLQNGRRVKDMRAIFERKNSEDNCMN